MKYFIQILGAMIALMSAACGTGVETGRRVSERDVKRVVEETTGTGASVTVTYRDSVPAWRAGKQFFVTDDNARLIFERSRDYDRDTLHLAHRVLTFVGCDTVMSLDGRSTVNLLFDDGPRRLVHRTNKRPGEFTSTFVVPFLVNTDLVEHYRRQLVGKRYYILTPIWFDIAGEQMKRGRKFIEVAIDSVNPGDKVLPLKLTFTAIDTGEQAMVRLSSGNELMNNRTFDALFALTNPHHAYPHIGNEHWQLIVAGKVDEGMTKEECRLSLGAPRAIAQIPDQTGLREVWSYDGGVSLHFVDGLLQRRQ